MTDTLTDLKFHIPTRIEYGLNKFAEIGKLLQGMGKRAFILPYKEKSLKPYLDVCQDSLNQETIASILFEEVVTNPPYTLIEKASKVAVDAGCDIVIGFVGGSAIDVAKTVAVMAVEKVGIWEIVNEKEINHNPLPMIAVPTTSGTGSDATQYDDISNPEQKRKEGIGKKEIHQEILIIDPMLSVDIPKSIPAAVGLDTLTHAVEDNTTWLASPVTYLSTY